MLTDNVKHSHVREGGPDNEASYIFASVVIGASIQIPPGPTKTGLERGGEKGNLARKMKHHTGETDLLGLIQSHKRIVKNIEEKGMKQTSPEDDLKARPLYRVKELASTSGWKEFSLGAAETKFEKGNPKWDEKLIKCPSGELYSNEKMMVYNRARDLENRYDNRPSQEWSERLKACKPNKKHNKSKCGECKKYNEVKHDIAAYDSRIGEMGEHLVTLVMEREAGGRAGLLLSGFWVSRYLKKEGTNEEGETVQPICFKERITRDTEHDVAYWNLNGDLLDIFFIQVKAIQRPNEVNLLSKPDNGLYQTEEDIRAFYALHPDFTATEKAKIRFNTIVAFPTVSRNDPVVHNWIYQGR